MQTAFAALCYFCENHGPRIVLTCQPVENSELKVNKQTKTASEIRKNGQGSVDDGPQFYDLYGDDEIVDDELRCSACSSFDQGMGMLSSDHEAEISFVSTQVPISERLNQILKQASLRSLSVEVSAPLYTTTAPTEANKSPGAAYASSQLCQNGDNERDGVVLFGDDENWYTLSYTFRLKDAKARGFHRSYSMVIVCMDKLLLLRNYDFLIHGLGAIITKLQEMTNSFFSLEQENDSELRLASNVKGAHWLPHQFYPKQYALDTSRSLKIITKEENIFTLLHRQMLTLLKTLTSLDQDIVLEGCPTQDMLIIMEMTNSGSLEERELVTQLSPKQALIQLGNLRLIANMLMECGPPNLLVALIWQVVIGEQVVVRCNSLPIRRLFLLAMVQLLPIGCIRLVTNAQQYLYSYKYNFLGCPLSVEVPEDAQNEVFLITLVKREGNNERAQGGGGISLEDYAINVEHYPVREESEKPTIVTRYAQLLLDPMINPTTLESALRATRNDWLNNAKLIFQLRHQREAIDLSKIMRIIKCKSQDSPVILFWQKGLSKRYKQVVLNTASHSSSLMRMQSSNSSQLT